MATSKVRVSHMNKSASHVVRLRSAGASLVCIDGALLWHLQLYVLPFSAQVRTVLIKCHYLVDGFPWLLSLL